jgi:uncharacterized repeat protein (TIGR03943 family)
MRAGLLDALVRQRRALVLLPWALTLLWLVRSGRYRDFVVPAFGPLLAAAYVAVLVLVLLELYRTEAAARAGARLLSAATLLVPLAFVLHARGARLDGWAYERRAVGLPTVTGGAAAGRADPAPAPQGRTFTYIPGRPAPIVGQEVAPVGEPSEEVSLRALYARPESYQGKQITVVGMAHGHERARREFGAQALVVYRFALSCCAADALPLSAVVLPAPGQPPPPDDAWVSVHGRLTLRDSSTGKVPVLEDASLAPTPEPRSPYL